ncbi:MAG: HD-GYP domain-containing protein [Syntrophales bacterium]
MIKAIRARDLKVGMYVLLPTSWFKHPFLKNQFKIGSRKEIQQIIELGLTEVKIDISKSSMPDEGTAAPEETAISAPKKWAPEQIVPRELREAIVDRQMPPRGKAVIIKECSLVLMSRLFEDPTARNIQEARRGISETVDFIISNDEISSHLISITSHDLYTYTHSVNVGILALLLAKRLFKGSAVHNLRELGSGFFLHDLGKVSIDPNIINKAGKLNDDEIRIMRRHPSEGAKILASAQQMTDESNIIVLQHHEREDGTGYPLGLKGPDIHIYARICAIADVYDALTSERSYKQKLNPLAALEMMRDEMLNHFQRDMFENFVFLFRG